MIPQTPGCKDALALLPRHRAEQPIPGIELGLTEHPAMLARPVTTCEIGAQPLDLHVGLRLVG